MATLIKPRLGRFEPLTLAHEFDSDESEAEDEIIMTKDVQLLRRIQQKIDRIARGFDFSKKDKKKNLIVEVEKVRKQVQLANSDSFFTYNSYPAIVLGTFMMWFAYAHLASGLVLNETKNVALCNKVTINMLLAGCGGAIGAQVLCRMFILFKLKKEKKDFAKYVDIGVDFDQQRAQSGFKKMTYYINIDLEIDVYVLCRGIIAGCVSCSVSPTNFESWAAFLNGFVAGFFLVLAMRALHIFRADDVTKVAPVHGAMACYSLFSIALFHKTEGFLFKQAAAGASTKELQAFYEKIMVIIGSNALAVLAVCFLILFLLVPVQRMVGNDLLRASKEQEIMG